MVVAETALLAQWITVIFRREQVFHGSILPVFRSHDMVGQITPEGNSDEQAAAALKDTRALTQSRFVIGEVFKTFETKDELH